MCMFLPSFSAFSNAKNVYLSCPRFDNRAPDLKVILDESNGTASLQSSSSGAGMNFTSQASFGPDKVQWRKDTKSLKQTFSVDRSTLVFQRKTISGLSGETYIDKSDCEIIKSAKHTKF